ncbi:Rid family hydrolase [Roseococcus sp. YIM B11640]|uniref:Rid family hydrolase n=1 Tax=Roseococcus sp. YIM B11640 TaxID=3133973 RepID=UPI003C7D35E4
MRQVFIRGQSGAGPDAAAQAEQAMQAATRLLAARGARIADICKVTTYVTDRAYDAPVQAVVARHLGGAEVAETALIVNGLTRPEMMVEIDIDAVIA